MIERTQRIRSEVAPAIEYLEAVKLLDEYSIQDGYCFHDEILLGPTQTAMVQRMRRHNDELQHWIEIGEIDDAALAIDQFLSLALKLPESHGYEP